MLKQRGFVVANRGSGTTVAEVPPVRVTGGMKLPPGVRDLASGNPDPELLPPLTDALDRVDPSHKLYGGLTNLPELTAQAGEEFERDAIPGDIAVTGGALDAIERALQAELRVGDRVVVEDPSWPRIGDLVRSLGLGLEPVPVDRAGLDPQRVDDALARGARAVIVTPRGQNPTGVSVDGERGAALREVHASHPEALVIEDDYVAQVSGAPYVPVHSVEGRWIVVRSLSKVVGPDLRIAVAAGDARTVSRIEGRQRLGPGWVSHILQQLASILLRDGATAALLERAEAVYAERRRALVAALATRGMEATGDSGLSVWVPLADEAAAVRELLIQGWAVSPGERYRFRTPPALRITTAGLEPSEAEELADAIASLRNPTESTYAG
jgi:DNA-binding transcriptional MocR family regulator